MWGPQSSILELLLWNLAYDAMLKLPLSQGSVSIVYTDDTLIVTGVNRAQERKNTTFDIVSEHIRDVGLFLAIVNTQAMMLTKRYGQATPLIILEGAAVPLGSSLSYLDIMLENKKAMFGARLRPASAKVYRVMSDLCRLMSNVRGPSKGKIRLFAGVVQSVLLYSVSS